MSDDKIGQENENKDDKLDESSPILIKPISPIPELKGLVAQRIEWIVILRALACMAVVMNHVVGWFYVNTVDVSERLNYGIVRSLINEIFLQPFVCFAVPVFIMISGCLLLNPKRDLNLKKIINYIVKTICLFFIFGFFYCLLGNLYQLRSEPFVDVITNLPIIIFHSCKDLINTTGCHLWYLIVLIGLYIFTPVLRIFVEHVDKKTALLVLLLLFVTTCIIPTINDYFDLNLFTFASVDRFIFLYLVGYFLANTDFIKDKYIYPSGIIGALIFIIACCFGVSDQLDAFMILESMMIFRMFSSGLIKIKNNKFINCISKYSLGIYVVHPFWLNLLTKLKIYFTVFPMIIGEIIFFAYGLLMSLITSMILYRLPLIKKLFIK